MAIRVFLNMNITEMYKMTIKKNFMLETVLPVCFNTD